jgi:hypothetical protein
VSRVVRRHIHILHCMYHHPEVVVRCRHWSSRAREVWLRAFKGGLSLSRRLVPLPGLFGLASLCSLHTILERFQTVVQVEEQVRDSRGLPSVPTSQTARRPPSAGRWDTAQGSTHEVSVAPQERHDLLPGLQDLSPPRLGMLDPLTELRT